MNTYIKIIDYITGALFGACMAVCALMAGRKDYWNFYHIGMLAGRAFQLIDDALDYYGKEVLLPPKNIITPSTCRSLFSFVAMF